MQEFSLERENQCNTESILASMMSLSYLSVCVCRFYKWWRDQCVLATRRMESQCSFLTLTAAVVVSSSLASWHSLGG